MADNNEIEQKVEKLREERLRVEEDITNKKIEIMKMKQSKYCWGKILFIF